MELYNETKVVVCGPHTYEEQGHPVRLSNEDHKFMTELVWSEENLFLDKI